MADGVTGDSPSGGGIQPEDAQSLASPAPIDSVTVNGQVVPISNSAGSLLDLLRDDCKMLSVKDGCSPQGQCGCCTVLVDGKARVACVTPAKRVRGRQVTTLEGLAPDRRQQWGDAFCRAGGSQCGFCTPGIIMRLDGLVDEIATAEGHRTEGQGVDADQPGKSRGEQKNAVDQALLAHLCRCTGWQTIHDTVSIMIGASSVEGPERDMVAASRRASLEGHGPQSVSAEVALGRGGFSADTAPDDALVAIKDANDQWVVGETLTEARRLASKIQGRRTTISHQWPLEVPPGEWARTMRTTWVDPAYLETDASWCRPGGSASSLAQNGGAFGGKVSDSLGLGQVARELADQKGRPVLALASREDTARKGPKRPPIAAGIRADGSGIIRVAATPGIADAIGSVAPDLEVEEVKVPGPPTSVAIRGAGWVEATVLRAGLTGVVGTVRSPVGAEATAELVDGTLKVSVRCGRVLDETVLRSYCIGAAHMAWSWLTSEALTVDSDGEVHDLTVRSFGVLRSVDTPPIEIKIDDDDGEPINGSDAVFAAVAAAGWIDRDCGQDWPLL